MMTLSPSVIADRAADVVRSAEQLLTRRTGAPVVLGEPEDLGGSARTVVLRVRSSENPFSLPRTMVIKKVLPEREPPGGLVGDEDGSDEAFLREVVCYQFANSLPMRHRPGAVLVAHDVGERILVLEDLGAAPTLSVVLANPDPALAQRGLIAWAQALGRMHAATASREDDFAALLRHAGRTAWTDPLVGSGRRALAELPEVVQRVLGVASPAGAVARAARTEYLVQAQGMRAFSPADLCPDNAMLTAQGVQFIDFECGGFRDVILDAVYALVPFPACWCSPQMAQEQAESVVQAWRSEVVGTWPELADDEVLQARLFDAQLLWTWVSTWWFLPGHAARRDPSAAHPFALPPAQALALRWSRLEQAAQWLGETVTAQHARSVLAALEELKASPAQR